MLPAGAENKSSWRALAQTVARPTAPTTARALAATQAALVANLVADGPAPAGFAADQLAEARSVLAAKRERVHAAHACHIVRA